jgi:hypothetical protein
VVASNDNIHNLPAVAPYMAIKRVHFLKSFADELLSHSSEINSSDDCIFRLSHNSPDLSQGILHHQYSFLSLNGVPPLVVFEISPSNFIPYSPL